MPHPHASLGRPVEPDDVDEGKRGPSYKCNVTFEAACAQFFPYTQIMAQSSKQLLTDCLYAAIKAAHPAVCLPAHLPPAPHSNVIVIGAGKAAAAMAQVVEDKWHTLIDEARLSGLVIVPYGSALPTRCIDVIEAAHPVPDQTGTTAARGLYHKALEAGADDLVVVLLSGGGSSLMAFPAGDIALAQKQVITDALLRSGATIDEINCVRKHLSAIKGGQLAKAASPARVLALVISDVIGDDLSVIASGPTVPDPTTRYDAMGLLVKYDIDIPEEVIVHCQFARNETPKEGDACFENTTNTLIARPMESLEAAAKHAREKGYDADILSDAIEGEAHEVGKSLAALAVAKQQQGFRGLLLSGGEVTVMQKHKATSHGGPNRECALAFALALKGAPGISALFADTDGVDGKTHTHDPVAGAYVDEWTLKRLKARNLDIKKVLRHHASEDGFEKIGDSIRTGPTHTNVNDFRAILVA